MKLITARAFNQDVTAAKRLALAEPVFVTDRGRPTHVLLSIAAYRRMAGEEDIVTDLLAADPGAAALDAAHLAAAMRPAG
ncbi:type II toxin-antitoxin system Phd/YefM family antitoxin [Sphingomonas sp. FW199]|uniref:type II toxin-antitoxin system Phd/YefM family antitoxin n=1 Tax=Sphingomonas sp. FW199 TaxID=3400217 RepID=UPI003CEA6E90